MRDLTVLWALRSPCNLGCRYCYFGSVDEDRVAPRTQLGVLSHLSRTDLSLAEITNFLASAGESAIERVFLAGGEPLIWPPIFTVIDTLVEAGIEVVVCTNGIPLRRPEIADQLVAAGVSAVSVSLDSASPSHNDTYRPARNQKDGWDSVLSGISTLLRARGSRRSPRVGLYSVITRRNIDAIYEVAVLAGELGVDYFVPQPIALDRDHALHSELVLRPEDAEAVRGVFDQLYGTDPHPVRVPAPGYSDMVLSTVVAQAPQTVTGCFGGHTLAFIEPDGSVWDCPSGARIAATPEHRRRSIRGATAAEVFPPRRFGCGSDCGLFSEDCVNMWPLMGFDTFLSPEAHQ